ncbi:MAG: hypothetical protein CMO55_11625 [Verrucomicrobiales bacterium]|nr:hypothetical protein [Verrucomicrobiales bacterium]
MKNTSIILALAALVITTLPAKADVWWEWYFASEAGYFLTDGDINDVVVDHAFTIKDIALTQTTLGFTAGTASQRRLIINQPNLGFQWNGTHATEFSRASGAYTNGANAFVEGHEHIFFGFQPNSGGNIGDSKVRHAKDNITYVSATLILIPIIPDVEARPDAMVGKTISPAGQIGKDVYSPGNEFVPIANQKVTVRARDKRNTKFYYSVNSDADVPEGFRVAGTRKNRQFAVKYRFWTGKAWTNVTGAMSRNGFTTPRYLPGENARIQVKVKPNTDGKRRARTFRCLATSRADGAISDLVKAKVKVKP